MLREHLEERPHGERDSVVPGDLAAEYGGFGNPGEPAAELPSQPTEQQKTLFFYTTTFVT